MGDFTILRPLKGKESSHHVFVVKFCYGSSIIDFCVSVLRLIDRSLEQIYVPEFCFIKLKRWKQLSRYFTTSISMARVSGQHSSFIDYINLVNLVTGGE